MSSTIASIALDALVVVLFGIGLFFLWRTIIEIRGKNWEINKLTGSDTSNLSLSFVSIGLGVLSIILSLHGSLPSPLPTPPIATATAKADNYSPTPIPSTAALSATPSPPTSVPPTSVPPTSVPAVYSGEASATIDGQTRVLDLGVNNGGQPQGWQSPSYDARACYELPLSLKQPFRPK